MTTHSGHTLDALVGHLMDQMNRLGNPDLKPDELQSEISRSGALAGLGAQVISAGRLAVDAAKARADLVPGDGPGVLGLTGPAADRQDGDSPKPRTGQVPRIGRGA
jgi:hypothetical protein